MDTIYSAQTVSVTELKRNFASIISQIEDNAVAVLNHNRPEAYLVSAKHYASLLDRLEDLEDMLLVLERQNEPTIPVKLDEL